MTSEASAFSALSGDLPSAWREAVQKQLRPHENVLAALEVDLDKQLHFVKGLVLLTNQRLLACEGATQIWSGWDLQAGQTLLHHDHAGVATLALRTLLQTPEWLAHMATLPGYTPLRCGEVLAMSTVLPWWQFSGKKRATASRKKP